MRLTVVFEPCPWIQRRACSRSRTVVPVLHYLRVLRGALRHHWTTVFWLDGLRFAAFFFVLNILISNNTDTDVNALPSLSLFFLIPSGIIVISCHFGRPIGRLAESDIYNANSGHATHSQPVSKKLVCDISTPFCECCVMKPLYRLVSWPKPL